jgi:transposase
MKKQKEPTSEAENNLFVILLASNWGAKNKGALKDYQIELLLEMLELKDIDKTCKLGKKILKEEIGVTI